MADEQTEDLLLEADKRKIRFEEQYRAAVRDELQHATKDKAGWMGFLNSNFGLWLLSALFISGLGSCYTNHQNSAREKAQLAASKRAEEARIRELTQRLDLEISYRLSLTMSRLEAADRRFAGNTDAQSKRVIQTAILPMTSPMNDQTPPLFPEFKSYSGLGLVAEVRRHVENGEKARLKKVLASLSGIVWSTGSDSVGKTVTPRIIAGELIATMKSQRWDNGFFYTDCSRETPFC